MKKEERAIFINKLGEQLRERRTSKGLSLRQAADAIGCKFGYLASIERGEVDRPKMAFLSRVARVYEMDEDYVVTMACRIPEDVYWRIVGNPDLISIIRSYDEVQDV